MTVAHMFSLDLRYDTSSGTGTMEYRHIDDVIIACRQYERKICTLMNKDREDIYEYTTIEASAKRMRVEQDG
jgi:hypothetical protein